GPFHRRYRRGPRLATTPLRIAAIAASGSGKDRGAIAPGLSALLCEHSGLEARLSCTAKTALQAFRPGTLTWRTARSASLHCQRSRHHLPRDGRGLLRRRTRAIRLTWHKRLVILVTEARLCRKMPCRRTPGVVGGLAGNPGSRK